MRIFLRKTNSLIHTLMLWVADIALLGMVVIVTMTVALRYLFNTGIGWAEEVPRLLVTLFAFLAMAMGVRDHIHIGVNVVYNLFPEDGPMRRFMLWFADFVVFLCGAFMLYYGGRRCMQMMNLPGKLPMTGLNTWVQYLPIPLAGFVISFDSLLFMTGVIDRDELCYSEPEPDFTGDQKEAAESDENMKEV